MYKSAGVLLALVLSQAVQVLEIWLLFLKIFMQNIYSKSMEMYNSPSSTRLSSALKNMQRYKQLDFSVVFVNRKPHRSVATAWSWRDSRARSRKSWRVMNLARHWRKGFRSLWRIAGSLRSVKACLKLEVSKASACCLSWRKPCPTSKLRKPWRQLPALYSKNFGPIRYLFLSSYHIMNQITQVHCHYIHCFCRCLAQSWCPWSRLWSFQRAIAHIATRPRRYVRAFW